MMTRTGTRQRVGHRATAVRVWGQRPMGGPFRSLLRTWWQRREHRLYLAAVAALGERTMLDLGFDPDHVRAEAAKPFWKA